MGRTYVSEAFKSLSLLNEEDFNINAVDGLEDAKEFINADEHDDTIDIIDPEAQTEEEIKDEYIGKVICECNVCHSLVYKNPADVILSEDGEMANEGEECPWCYSSNGFKVVGMVAAYQKEEEQPADDQTADEIAAEAEEVVDAAEEAGEAAEDAEEVIDAAIEGEEPKAEEETEEEKEEEKVEEALTEEVKEDVCPKCGKNPCECEKEEQLTEEVHEVEVKTEDQKIEVKPGENGEISIEIKNCDEALEEPAPELPIEAPIEAPVEGGEEVIAPLEPEVQAEIENNTGEEEMPAEEEVIEEPEDLDFDVDDFDEESFDELGEGYLKKVYENVDGFKTTSVKNEGNSLIVEGMIKFHSGNEKSTKFVFEATEATKEGNVRFLGENKHFSRGKKSFALQGNVAENKFIAESLTYNYHAKDAEGKAVRLYDTIKRNK